MKTPLISVIICFLNPGEWLREAVDSVIRQTCGNWELILVDDGSVEADSQVARAYMHSYPDQIRYTDHPGHRNIGLTASRNVGIRLAGGQFIAFLDADDYWYSDKLSKQLLLFENFPKAAMICEASRFWYSWLNDDQEDPVITIGAPEGLHLPGTLNKRLYPLGKGQPPCPSGIIIRKTALLRTGIFEERFSGVYQLYEDQAFLAKMYLNEMIYISAEANNKYRKHQGSMCGAAEDPHLYAEVRSFFLEWLSNYLVDKQIRDQPLQELIRAAQLQVSNPGPE